MFFSCSKISFEKRHRRKYPEFKDFVFNHKIPCAYCGDKFISRKDITIEHVDDLFHGGNDSLDNIIAAHEHCNNARGSIKNTIWYKKHTEIPFNFFNYLKKMEKYKPKGFNYSSILRKKLIKIINTM